MHVSSFTLSVWQFSSLPVLPSSSSDRTERPASCSGFNLIPLGRLNLPCCRRRPLGEVTCVSLWFIRVSRGGISGFATEDDLFISFPRSPADAGGKSQRFTDHWCWRLISHSGAHTGFHIVAAAGDSVFNSVHLLIRTRCSSPETTDRSDCEWLLLQRFNDHVQLVI